MESICGIFFSRGRSLWCREYPKLVNIKRRKSTKIGMNITNSLKMKKIDDFDRRRSSEMENYEFHPKRIHWKWKLRTKKCWPISCIKQKSSDRFFPFVIQSTRSNSCGAFQVHVIFYNRFKWHFHAFICVSVILLRAFRVFEYRRVSCCVLFALQFVYLNGVLYCCQCKI